MAADLLSVVVRGNEIDVRYPSAVDGSACSETIQSRDIVRIVLERSGDRVHWFLQHRAGWTLHFHDGFENAAQVISWLEGFGNFTVPASRDIAGPGTDGTVVWSSA
jgi:hypothetical protein